MIDFLNILLAVAVIGCLLYIYWLHHSDNIKQTIKKVTKKEEPVVEEDNASFLKSNYDTNLSIKNDSEDEGESLFSD